MNHKFLTMLILVGLLEAGKAAAQTDTNAPMGTDYQSFQMIASRSIFNPSRTGPRSPPTRVSYTPVTRFESFTLVGTLSSEKGQFAFFNGSSSSYHKTLGLGQAIAGYKIAEINGNSVKLAATSNQTINLPIGTQMRRYDNGRWTVAGQAEPSSVASAPSSDGTNAAPAAGATPASPAILESDAAKRLRLKRLNEQ